MEIVLEFAEAEVDLHFLIVLEEVCDDFLVLKVGPGEEVECPFVEVPG